MLNILFANVHVHQRRFQDPVKYLRWRLPISPKSETVIFPKNSSNDIFGFWREVSTKYDLQFELNLFFRKMCNLEIFDLKIVEKLPKLRFLAIFSNLHY